MLYSNTNNDDIYWIKQNSEKYSGLIHSFDNGIEDRARHYTSNLVKLGFTDEKRTDLSEVGKSAVSEKLQKDELEKLLPLSALNVLYLRQLLKVRIFAEDEKSFYSPFAFALYMLLKNDRISTEDFCEMIQGLSPYSEIENIDDFVKNYKTTSIVENLKVENPFSEELIPYDEFKIYFKNGKSETTVKQYYRFYTLFFTLVKSKKQTDLNNFLDFYDEAKAAINKAFGYERNLFSLRRAERPEITDFISDYEEFFTSGFNGLIYEKFTKSKRLDLIHEYSDTTIRIFKATGIISFDNGYVELVNKDLCALIFSETILKERIFGKICDEKSPNYKDYSGYEGSLASYFCSNYSLSEIFDYDSKSVNDIENSVSKTFGSESVDGISKLLEARRRKEFEKFIAEKYPKDEVRNLLNLFSDRKNDRLIKEIVSDNASVPTIYEYVVGIAWYYFSGKSIDLLSSLNLTLSANFEPLLHAGGGQGDIVIYSKDKVVMLEATLMNENSQKRGEWEPVLRHSVNLKIDEEAAGTGRRVVTFFLSDKFDWNTINIWKAVAAVPLQSSVDKDKFTDNVAIMPVNNAELCALLDKEKDYDKIIDDVMKLFKVDTNFDFRWRENFIATIV